MFLSFCFVDLKQVNCCPLLWLFLVLFVFYRILDILDPLYSAIGLPSRLHIYICINIYIICARFLFLLLFVLYFCYSLRYCVVWLIFRVTICRKTIKMNDEKLVECKAQLFLIFFYCFVFLWGDQLSKRNVKSECTKWI